jgi:adenosine deaminase
MTVPAPIEEFIAALPKVELHVHLEGSMRPETLLALATKHGVGDLSGSLEELRSWYEFQDFAHFIAVYRRAVDVLRDEDDFALLTLDATLAHGPDSVIGFSIGWIEVDRGPFAELFARARAAGLRSLPHAGEARGPENVWAAIQQLKADRIGHGIASLRDPALVEYLREAQLPLDVSPTSNLCTRRVPRLDDHPLPRMIDAGLLVTLNSDDPPMFDTDLTNEYRTAHRLGIDRAGLAQLARNGVRASFLPPERKTTLLAEIDSASQDR